MTGEYYFTSFLALALRFLPTILDSGIQIWNGVVIDQMVKSEEIGYPGPFFIVVPQRRRRSTEESSSIFNIHLTEVLTFQVTVEGLVSIGLVQLPGLFLAIYGITKALDKAIERPGNNKQAAKDSLHASVLMFLPFFLIEIVSFFEFALSSAFNACFGFLCGQGVKQSVKKFDFLHFLGKKDPTGKAKLLCLDASKVFFGSCLQLCLQVFLLQFSFVKRPSQLLSILFSCLVITKTCFEIITYQRIDENSNESEDTSANGELDENEESEKNKDEASKGNAIKGVLIKVLKMFWEFLKYVPLLGSSLLFNIGTLTISIIFLGWYSGIGIALELMANIFTATMLSFNKTVRKADKYHLTLYGARLGSEERNKATSLEKLWMCYTNIFIINRPVQDCTKSRINFMYLVQPLHFIINSLCLFVYLCLGTEFFYPDFYPDDCRWTDCPVILEHFSLILIIFLFAGVLNILLCFTKCACNVYVGEVTEYKESIEMINIKN